MLLLEPEHLVVHDKVVKLGPHVSVLGDGEVEVAKRVSSNEQCGTLSGSQTKVFLEEVSSHLAITLGVRMTLFLGGHPWSDAFLLFTIRTTCQKLDSLLWHIDSAVSLSKSQMSTFSGSVVLEYDVI